MIDGLEESYKTALEPREKRKMNTVRCPVGTFEVCAPFDAVTEQRLRDGPRVRLSTPDGVEDGAPWTTDRAVSAVDSAVILSTLLSQRVLGQPLGRRDVNSRSQAVVSDGRTSPDLCH